MFSRTRVALGIAVLTFGAGATLSSVGAPSASAAAATRVDVLAIAPKLPAEAVATGNLNARQTINGVVGLKPVDAPALASFAEAVSDPSSPLHGHYLKPGEFGRVFGSATEAKALASVLRNEGLRVTSISSNGLLVNFRGSTSEVDRKSTRLNSSHMPVSRMPSSA